MVRIIIDINEEDVEEYKTIRATTVKVEAFKKFENETKNEIKIMEKIMQDLFK